MSSVIESCDVAGAETLEQIDSGSTSARRERRLAVIRTCSILITLAIWEIFGRQINPLFMSYPSKIVLGAITLIQAGALQEALAESLRTLVLGYAAAAVFGVLVGLGIGRYREVEAALDWLTNALYATPLVALIPLVILWFGLGFTAKVFVVFLFTLFPVLINTSIGVKNVNRALIDVGVAFVANERQIFTKIILPASLPYIMAGLRLGIGRAIIGMVTAEFFTAISGLGGLVVKYGNQFR
ncbi:MAG TPA: ABC transporter permease, partial [Candidatus Acidoferrales bacterium]|nr:ABC transporter permease [Candidatus Acidoferrales bacterium]